MQSNTKRFFLLILHCQKLSFEKSSKYYPCLKISRWGGHQLFHLRDVLGFFHFQRSLQNLSIPKSLVKEIGTGQLDLEDEAELDQYLSDFYDSKSILKQIERRIRCIS